MSTGYNDSPEFGALAASLAQRLVPLTGAIVQLNRRISCLNGERGDGEDSDVPVWHLLATTRSAFREAAAGVKRIVDWGNTTTITNDASPAMKSTQHKLLAQFASTLMDFQSVQKLYAEKRNRVAGQRQPEGQAERYRDEAGAGAGERGEDWEEHEEEEEGEEEGEVERGIALVDGIFKDLGIIVGDPEQQLVGHVGDGGDVADLEEDALLGAGRHGQGWRRRGRRRAALVALLGALLLVFIVVLGLCVGHHHVTLGQCNM